MSLSSRGPSAAPFGPKVVLGRSGKVTTGRNRCRPTGRPAGPAGGFTLIELLVVLSIIGIIVSFTARRNTVVVERSRDAAVMLDLGNLRTAVHQFALDAGGRFPASLEDLFPRFVNRKPTSWQGARGAGAFGYDPETGRVTLLPAEGSAKPIGLDSRGRSYADY